MVTTSKIPPIKSALASLDVLAKYPTRLINASQQPCIKKITNVANNNLPTVLFVLQQFGSLSRCHSNSFTALLFETCNLCLQSCLHFVTNECKWHCKPWGEIVK